MRLRALPLDILNCCKNPEKIKLEIKKPEKQISKQQNPEKKYRN